MLIVWLGRSDWIALTAGSCVLAALAALLATTGLLAAGGFRRLVKKFYTWGRLFLLQQLHHIEVEIVIFFLVIILTLKSKLSRG